MKRFEKTKPIVLVQRSVFGVLCQWKLKKQSQFIRAEFSVLRIASMEVEKTKPMLIWAI